MLQIIYELRICFSAKRDYRSNPFFLNSRKKKGKSINRNISVPRTLASSGYWKRKFLQYSLKNKWKFNWFSDQFDEENETNSEKLS